MILKQEGDRIWNLIKSGKFLDDPTLLSNFFILSFADIKLFKFYYWFCFPSPTKPLAHTSSTQLLSDFLTTIEFNEFQRACSSAKDKSFFIIEKINESLHYRELKEKIDRSNYEKNFADNDQIKDTYFCFSDPSEYENPGWNLRLFIVALYHTCPNLHGKTIKIISIRMKTTKSYEDSLLFEIILPQTQDNASQNENIQWIGWETNETGKMLPRVADMHLIMDPKYIAQDSVNLNLRLMKWRLLPDLNLDVLQNVKCLIFGMGTLGCNVARTLLGWGVNHMTFIDAGHVSHSNPVRQNLYTHQDAIDKKRKVDAAKQRVTEIHPQAVPNGYHAFIPMPGHPVGESTVQSTIDSIDRIKQLVKEHDVIFMLTDSRESRWLPTLLGAYYDKVYR